MSAVSNPFVRDDVGRRYRAYRPDYSPHLTAILRDTVGHVDTALDVGAGTGISTTAVAAVADCVVAVDASAAMAAHARHVPNTAWVLGGAESLPFVDGVFDLLTVGSALHWFQRDEFTSHAARVTTGRAFLVVHEHAFTGQMEGVAAFSAWIHRRYLRGYPAPPRGEKLAPGTDLGPFRFLATFRYEQTVDVTRDTLAGYLTTQSNLQVVMTTRRAAGDVQHWLEQELDPFFAEASTRTVRFAGVATALRRS